MDSLLVRIHGVVCDLPSTIPSIPFFPTPSFLTLISHYWTSMLGSRGWDKICLNQSQHAHSPSSSDWSGRGQVAQIWPIRHKGNLLRGFQEVILPLPPNKRGTCEKNSFPALVVSSSWVRTLSSEDVILGAATAILWPWGELLPILQGRQEKI